MGLSILLSMTLLTSCNNNKKVNFNTGDLTINEFVEINQEELDSLRESKSDFVVLVYTRGCLSCAEYEARLQHYIDNFGLTIYKTLYSSLKSSDELKRFSSTAPVLGFYKDGKKIHLNKYQNFEKQKDFNAFFETYVSLPDVFYISPSMLDEKIANKHSFVVLFTRSTCGDCGYLFDEYLNNYINQNKGKTTFYIIECDGNGIREYDEDGKLINESEWIEFKNKYHLSKSSSEQFGFKAGVVPTFQFYKDGTLNASDVYVNETYEKVIVNGQEVNGELVTYRYTITESFFKELVGRSFEHESTYYEIGVCNLADFVGELNRTAKAKRDFVKDYHNDKLQQFLDSYAH